MFEARDGRSGVYANERQGRRRASRLIVGSLCGGFLLTASLWFVFVSGYFHVAEIRIEGIKDLQAAEVTSSTYAVIDRGPWKPWDKQNLFFTDPSYIAAALKDELFAESVAVEKIFPNVLRLIIKERQRSVVLVSKGQFLLVDTQGIVTSDALNEVLDSAQQRVSDKALTTLNQLPVLVHDLPEPATAGYQAADGEGIRGWLESSQRLIEAQVKYRYLDIPDLAGTTMRVRTDGNIMIVMERGPVLEAQIEMYRKFLDSKKKEVQIREYIDVRVPGKIFFK